MADLTQRPPEQLVKQASDWWSTSIVDIEPEQDSISAAIRFRT